MTAQQFMDNWHCTDCGGTGYIYPGEIPCRACLNASKEYQRLRRAETPQNSPKTHGAKKVVHISRADGTTETDAQWWARQGELADLAATMDAASYRGQ